MTYKRAGQRGVRQSERPRGRSIPLSRLSAVVVDSDRRSRYRSGSTWQESIAGLCVDRIVQYLLVDRIVQRGFRVRATIAL